MLCNPYIMSRIHYIILTTKIPFLSRKQAEKNGKDQIKNNFLLKMWIYNYNTLAWLLSSKLFIDNHYGRLISYIIDGIITSLRPRWYNHCSYGLDYEFKPSTVDFCSSTIQNTSQTFYGVCSGSTIIIVQSGH